MNTATSSFISGFTSVLILVDMIFHNFLELHSTLSERFRHIFSFFNEFTQLNTPDPFNGQNLLSVTILSIFSKLPSDIFFFKNLLTKSCKRIFYVSAVNCHCHCIFNSSNYRFSGLLFRTYFKSSYFDTSISSYL